MRKVTGLLVAALLCPAFVRAQNEKFTSPTLNSIKQAAPEGAAAPAPAASAAPANPQPPADQAKALEARKTGALCKLMDADAGLRERLSKCVALLGTQAMYANADTVGCDTRDMLGVKHWETLMKTSEVRKLWQAGATDIDWDGKQALLVYSPHGEPAGSSPVFLPGYDGDSDTGYGTGYVYATDFVMFLRNYKAVPQTICPGPEGAKQ